MGTRLNSMVKRAFGFAGLDVRRSSSIPAPLIRQFFDDYRVDTIFDIGANSGMSGEYFRKIGFPGTIVSFEPIAHLFDQLKVAASHYQHWFVERIALGPSAGEADIHVTGGHAGASSILKMTNNVLENAPDQEVVSTERIEIATLDSMMDRYYPSGDRAFLKIDVQGFEKSVLDGGTRSLDRVIGMKIEMSLVRNYEGELLFFDMIPFIYSLGFRLVHFQDGWGNRRTRELYQVDGVFFRTDKFSKTPH
jgi:FkbM family methyltransferase